MEEYSSFLSLGGMLLRTGEPRPVGSEVRLEIELTDGFRLIQGVGEVVWVRPGDFRAEPPAGMAIRFQALDEQGRDLILKIQEEQVKGGGKPFDVDEIPPDASTAPSAELGADAETGAPLEPVAGAGELPAPDAVPDVKLEAVGGCGPGSRGETSSPADLVAVEAPSIPPLPEVCGSVLDYEDDLFRDEPRRLGAPARWATALALAAVLLAAAAHLWRKELGELGTPLGSLRETAQVGTPAGDLRGSQPIEARASGLPVIEESRAGPDPGVEPAAAAGEGRSAEQHTRKPEPPGESQVGAREAATDFESTRRAPTAGDPGPAVPAARVEEVSWTRDAQGIWVVVELDGELAAGRIAHDALVWAPDKEQISITGIGTLPDDRVLEIDGPELLRVRSGLHEGSQGPELRLVFDLGSDGVGISELRSRGSRLQVLVRRRPR